MTQATAWDNPEICRHILATQFPPLKDSVHFPSLRECVSSCLLYTSDAADE